MNRDFAFCRFLFCCLSLSVLFLSFFFPSILPTRTEVPVWIFEFFKREIFNEFMSVFTAVV